MYFIDKLLGIGAMSLRNEVYEVLITNCLTTNNKELDLFRTGFQTFDLTDNTSFSMTTGTAAKKKRFTTFQTILNIMKAYINVGLFKWLMAFVRWNVRLITSTKTWEMKTSKKAPKHC